MTTTLAGHSDTPMRLPCSPKALGSRMLAVEYAGSTSIPGMPSKPVIDILAALPDYSGFHQVVQRLEIVGYICTAGSEADDPARRVFR